MIWPYLFFLMLGIAGGMFISVKWLFPESGEITLGKLVIRGRQNTVTDVLDVDIKKEGMKRREQRKRLRDRKKQG